MREVLSSSLAAIVLTFALSLFAGCENKEILKQMEKHSKSVKSLRTDITINRFNSQLGESDITKGKLIYLPQNGSDVLVRIDLIKPTQESLTFVNKEYLIYRPRLEQAIIGKIDNSQISETVSEILGFLNVSKEHLRANYDIKYMGEEKISDGVLTHHLEFTPKTAKNYKKAEFWADDKGMPVQMKVVENNNDSITVLFTNIEKNAVINLDVFKINLPKNTTIIKP